MYNEEDELQHHGVLGQKWGIRRYQNKDGSLTAAGRKRKATSGSISKKFEKFNKNRIKAAQERKEQKKAKAEEAKRHTKTKRLDNSKVKRMTDEDLKKATDRLNLERNYVEANNNYLRSIGKDPSQKTFRDKVKVSLEDSFNSALKSVGNQAFNYGMTKLINSLVGEDIKTGGSVKPVDKNSVDTLNKLLEKVGDGTKQLNKDDIEKFKNALSKLSD